MGLDVESRFTEGQIRPVPSPFLPLPRSNFPPCQTAAGGLQPPPHRACRNCLFDCGSAAGQIGYEDLTPRLPGFFLIYLFARVLE